MVINEVFTNPTVKKVIFQIRFPNLFYIENKIGEIQLKLMKEFPESALIHKQTIVFTDVGPKGEIKKNLDNFPEESTNKIWQFESEKKYKLNIQSNSLDISSSVHKTYNNPKSDIRFRDIMEFVLNSFFEVTQIPVIKRIGLRYIDECPIPEEKTSKAFKEYYKTTFPLARFKLEDAEQLNFRAVVKRADLSLTFNESFSKTENDYKLILDFDAYKENIDPDECLAVSDRLHDLIIKEYELSLKDPVYDYMRKEPSNS